MGKEEIQYCPICRKNELEQDQILCTECKSDNPYNLLGGYSPTKKIYDELNKVGEYKDQISKLETQLKFTSVLVLLLAALVIGVLWVK